MNYPAKESCQPLPEEARIYLMKLANRDLTRVRNLTNKIHLCFEQLNKKKISKDHFTTEVQQLLHDTFEHIQDLSNLNIAFPHLFSDEQQTILTDMMQLTTQLNLQYPNAANYTEFENGQIGGAAMIMQQQWAS